MLFDVDNKTVVAPAADLFDLVPYLGVKAQSATIHLYNGNSDIHGHAERRGAQVIDRDVRPHRFLTFLQVFDDEVMGNDLDIAHMK